MKLEYFLERFSKNTRKLTFMKTRPVPTESFHAEWRKDGHDAAKSRLSPYFERA